MTGILADANIEGHLDYLFDLLTSKAWTEFWQALGIRYATFEEIGLTADDTDDVVWQACQDNGYVLIASNRNQKGAASLEATIRERATIDSLPVLTLADAEHVPPSFRPMGAFWRWRRRVRECGTWRS